MTTDAFDRATKRAEDHQHRRSHERSRRYRSQIQRTALRIHAAAYVTVQVLLFAIWLIAWQFGDGTAHPWFVYPLLGWGIGLAVHFAAVSQWLKSTPSHE